MKAADAARQVADIYRMKLAATWDTGESRLWLALVEAFEEFASMLEQSAPGDTP